MKLRITQFFRPIVFGVILCLLMSILNFYLYNDNTYTRVMFHEMYESEQIDIALIGSSNVYRHFDPEIWDKYLGMYTFNLGTSSQAPDSAYYIMKEVFKNQSPKYCIYGINSILFLDMPRYDNPKKGYIVFDYLNFSIDKCMYGYTVFRDKSLLNAWVPATRNANKDLIKTAKDVAEIKKTDMYQTYGYEIYKRSNEEYRGRGFVYSYKQTEKGAVGKPTGSLFSGYEVSDKYISYMKKLKNLCDEEDCELIFVVPPLPYASMEAQDNYQEILDFYDEIATELDVTIFNFDLVKSEYLLMEDDDFYDYAHMSGKGAEKFSSAASQIVKKYIDGAEINKGEYFYASYEDLLAHSPWIFNTWAEKTEKGYIAYSQYGSGVIPEYCFQWSDDSGMTWHILQEYSENDQISDNSIPDGCNMLMVWSKPKDMSVEEIDYQQCDRVTVK